MKFLVNAVAQATAGRTRPWHWLAGGLLVVALGCEAESGLHESARHEATALETTSLEPTAAIQGTPAATAEPSAAGTVAATTEPTPTPTGTATAGPVRTKDITFDTVKFDIEKDGAYDPKLLTDEIRNLVGKTVRIRGYIHPGSAFQQTGLKQFVLVRDNLECCFGPGAAIYDCMVVEMADQAETNFNVRPIAVEGTFELEPLEIDGRLWGLFRLRGSVVP